jgi:signal transduction histidine kinase
VSKRVVIAFCLLLIVLVGNAALAAWCVDHFRTMEVRLLPERGGPSAIDFRVLFLTIAAGTAVALGLAALAIYLDLQDRAVRQRAAEVLRQTERRREQAEARDREARLREAGRQKDEFLAMLAHELRNPLAPLRNAVQLLRLRGTDPDTVTWARELIERQTAHITRIVDDLLDAARMARGTVHLQRQRLDLADLMRTAVEDHRGSLATAGLTLEVNLPSEPIWVQGDPTRLAQVIGNLLHNAAKFTDAGGRVEVRVGQADGFASVTVQDTGLGIDPAMLPRLFEPLSQADRTLERSRGGLGLGLALVKGLVELHGGRVEAFSDGPNQGASLTFWLPIDQGPYAPEASRPAAGGTARQLRVLVIEAKRDVADSLQVLLQLLGHEVTVASSGPEGLEEARKVRPEVVLCDLDLPGMSGYEVARALRQDPATGSVRLIAVSDYGQEEDQRQALASGFTRVLLKPVDPDGLQRLLADLP